MSREACPFKGTHNFRDIGLYQTKNGKELRKGLIFRSDNLSKLTKKDLQTFSDLEIKTVIDLRSPQERDYQPSRLPMKKTPRIIELNLTGSELDYVALYKKALRGKLGEFDFQAFIRTEYRHYVTQSDEELKELFCLLLNKENYPLVIHCSGGKDRTGIVIALIHIALGVSTEHVFQNYLLSQQYLECYTRNVMRKIQIFSLFRTNREQLAPLLSTNASFLQEALDTIKLKHGSFDRYLESLGVDRESKIQLERLLCT